MEKSAEKSIYRKIRWKKKSAEIRGMQNNGPPFPLVHALLVNVWSKMNQCKSLLQEDPVQRSKIEDDLIAWTWRQFILDVNDTEVEEDTRMLARNAMCKVKAQLYTNATTRRAFRVA